MLWVTKLVTAEIYLQKIQNLSYCCPIYKNNKRLESLLRQIERTEKKQENLDFSFPDEDSRAIAIRVQDIQDQPSELVDSEEEIERPKFTEQEIPSSGWSVQVGSYTTLEEAQIK